MYSAGLGCVLYSTGPVYRKKRLQVKLLLGILKLRIIRSAIARLNEHGAGRESYAAIRQHIEYRGLALN